MPPRSANFHTTTTFLSQRGLIRPVRRLVALIGLASAIIASANLFLGHLTGWHATVTVAVCALSLGAFALWAVRWPTRGLSVSFTVAGVVAIVAWSVVQPTATAAALACTAAAVTGTYAAFFHGPRLVALNLVIAVTGTAGAALRIQTQDGLLAAITSFWVVTFVVLMVPLAIGGMARAMREYATKSEQDTLTGLLNRRALVAEIGHRHTEAGAPYVAVALVDIDDFKQVNDTRGHDAGDEVLRAVAHLLRTHAPPSSLICRAGGEEFIIAVLSAVPVDGAKIAHELCTAIRSSAVAVTVSVGSATGVVGRHADVAAETVLEELIIAADRAMYVAKRKGGDRYCDVLDA